MTHCSTNRTPLPTDAEGFHVLVCGGRDYGAKGSEVLKVRCHLNKLRDERGITLIINGGAKGADALARDWARSKAIPYLTCPADWETHGRAAGPIRNKLMLSIVRVDLVLAFPGGKGTASMCRLATEAGVPVQRVE